MSLKFFVLIIVNVMATFVLLINSRIKLTFTQYMVNYLLHYKTKLKLLGQLHDNS